MNNKIKFWYDLTFNMKSITFTIQRKARKYYNFIKVESRMNKPQYYFKELNVLVRNEIMNHFLDSTYFVKQLNFNLI